MRIRQVKPAYWRDSVLVTVSAATREFYIGLWMLADDAGWLTWNVPEIGSELYSFEGRAKRERRIERMADELKVLPVEKGKRPRLVVHDCGHAEVPRMPEHQHLAGSTRRVLVVRDEHAKECFVEPPAPTRDDPRSPASARAGKERVSVGSFSDGKGTRPPARSGAADAPDDRPWNRRLRPEAVAS